MRLRELAKQSAEGILREWHKWDEEAGGRAQDAQDISIYGDLMTEFLSAEIEEQMAIAFNRGYKAAKEAAAVEAAGIANHDEQEGDAAEAVVLAIHCGRGDAYEKEFSIAPETPH